MPRMRLYKFLLIDYYIGAHFLLLVTSTFVYTFLYWYETALDRIESSKQTLNSMLLFIFIYSFLLITIRVFKFILLSLRGENIEGKINSIILPRRINISLKELMEIDDAFTRSSIIKKAIGLEYSFLFNDHLYIQRYYFFMSFFITKSFLLSSHIIRIYRDNPKNSLPADLFYHTHVLEKM